MTGVCGRGRPPHVPTHPLTPPPGAPPVLPGRVSPLGGRCSPPCPRRPPEGQGRGEGRWGGRQRCGVGGGALKRSNLAGFFPSPGLRVELGKVLGCVVCRGEGRGGPRRSPLSPRREASGPGGLGSRQRRLPGAGGAGILHRGCRVALHVTAQGAAVSVPSEIIYWGMCGGLHLGVGSSRPFTFPCELSIHCPAKEGGGSGGDASGLTFCHQ